MPLNISMKANANAMSITAAHTDALIAKVYAILLMGIVNLFSIKQFIEINN